MAFFMFLYGIEKEMSSVSSETTSINSCDKLCYKLWSILSLKRPNMFFFLFCFKLVHHNLLFHAAYALILLQVFSFCCLPVRSDSLTWFKRWLDLLKVMKLMTTLMPIVWSIYDDWWFFSMLVVEICSGKQIAKTLFFGA